MRDLMIYKDAEAYCKSKGIQIIETKKGNDEFYDAQNFSLPKAVDKSNTNMTVGDASKSTANGARSRSNNPKTPTDRGQIATPTTVEEDIKSRLDELKSVTSQNRKIRDRTSIINIGDVYNQRKLEREALRIATEDYRANVSP